MLRIVRLRLHEEVRRIPREKTDLMRTNIEQSNEKGERGVRRVLLVGGCRVDQGATLPKLTPDILTLQKNIPKCAILSVALGGFRTSVVFSICLDCEEL